MKKELRELLYIGESPSPKIPLIQVHSTNQKVFKHLLLSKIYLIMTNFLEFAMDDTVIHGPLTLRADNTIVSLIVSHF